MSDFYCYPGTKVLKNRFQIMDDAEPDRVESNIVFLKLAERDRLAGICRPGFQLKELRALHAFLFGDIYDWAGTIREIEMIKHEEILGGPSVQYSYPTEIERDARAALRQLHQIQWAAPIETVAERLALSGAALWQVHPFREGNTRTVITFLCEMAEYHGHAINRGLFRRKAGFTRNALVMASLGKYAEPEYLIHIFHDALADEGAE